MKAPQLILVGLLCLSLGISMCEHGKEKVKKENAWYAIIAAAIQFGLLYWGGFFSQEVDMKFLFVRKFNWMDAITVAIASPVCDKSPTLGIIIAILGFTVSAMGEYKYGKQLLTTGWTVLKKQYIIYM